MTRVFISNLARSIVATVLVAFAAIAIAQESVPANAGQPAQSRSLDQDVQALKNEVLDLNRDLFLLVEDLLFPANSQVALFVSMDVGEYFALDSVNIKIDGKEVGNFCLSHCCVLF